MTQRFTHENELLHFAVFHDEIALSMIDKQAVRIVSGYAKKQVQWDFILKNGIDWRFAMNIESVMSDSALAAAKRGIRAGLEKICKEGVIMDSNKVNYLLLGGDFHGQIFTGYLMSEIRLHPKSLSSDRHYERPTITTDDSLVYKVEEYRAESQLMYLIATCHPIELFDIEYEINKAQLPHFSQSNIRWNTSELYRQ
jgi:hypothetical protein